MNVSVYQLNDMSPMRALDSSTKGRRCLVKLAKLISVLCVYEGSMLLILLHKTHKN